MTRVVVVSRTCMGATRVCVGALTKGDHHSVRLLPRDGSHGWPLDAPYEVGDVWDIDYRPPPQIEVPHTEDVLVADGGRRIAEQARLGTYLATRVSIWSGPPTQLFDGKLEFTPSGSGYLPLDTDVMRSVGFWRPDARLLLHERRYAYDAGWPTRSVKYVGTAEAAAEIPEGALVRVSLSRRWGPVGEPERFWLQISGWYLETAH